MPHAVVPRLKLSAHCCSCSRSLALRRGFPDWGIWSLAPTAQKPTAASMCNIIYYPPLDRDRRDNLENPRDRPIRASGKMEETEPPARPAAGCLSWTCTCSAPRRRLVLLVLEISFMSSDQTCVAWQRQVGRPAIFLLPERGGIRSSNKTRCMVAHISHSIQQIFFETSHCLWRCLVDLLWSVGQGELIA